jgi:hypothetical protein
MENMEKSFSQPLADECRQWHIKEQTRQYFVQGMAKAQERIKFQQKNFQRAMAGT